ncbi:MAG: hydroxyacylglutathione hydrolase [Parashewanella sp.]
MLTITPIKAFNDNYIWCIIGDNNQAYVVDPGASEPIVQFLQSQQLSLAGILITHHHHDHIGGIEQLQSSTNATLPIFGPKSEFIPQVTHIVSEQTRLQLPYINCEIQILEIPGHTLDHIAFLIADNLFCGDTLFSGGCGRIFEGTPTQMWQSLNKLKRLPISTKVFCAHEYTLNNLLFAEHVDPKNLELRSYINWVKQQTSSEQPTLPSTIANELKINPFLRCDNQLIQGAIAQYYHHQKIVTEAAYFSDLRKWKDNF